MSKNNYFKYILIFFLIFFSNIIRANPNEVVCDDGVFIGTNTTTADFLEIGTSSGDSDLGFLDSASGNIGGSTSGEPSTYHCGIASNSVISGLSLADGSCASGTADLINEFILVKAGNNTFYGIKHIAYGNWDSGNTLMIAHKCDSSGDFDSTTGCSISTQCVSPLIISAPLNYIWGLLLTFAGIIFITFLIFRHKFISL